MQSFRCNSVSHLYSIETIRPVCAIESVELPAFNQPFRSLPEMCVLCVLLWDNRRMQATLWDLCVVYIRTNGECYNEIHWNDKIRESIHLSRQENAIRVFLFTIDPSCWTKHNYCFCLQRTDPVSSFDRMQALYMLWISRQLETICYHSVAFPLALSHFRTNNNVSAAEAPATRIKQIFNDLARWYALCARFIRSQMSMPGHASRLHIAWLYAVCCGDLIRLSRRLNYSIIYCMQNTASNMKYTTAIVCV